MPVSSTAGCIPTFNTPGAKQRMKGLRGKKLRYGLTCENHSIRIARRPMDPRIRHILTDHGQVTQVPPGHAVAEIADGTDADLNPGKVLFD